MTDLGRFDDDWLIEFRRMSGITDDVALNCLQRDLQEVGKHYVEITGMDSSLFALAGQPLADRSHRRLGVAKVSTACRLRRSNCGSMPTRSGCEFRAPALVPAPD